MRSCVWAALLRCVPPEQHNILMIVTRGGVEIAVQNFLNIGEEMLSIKGRLAGSQDAGRLYFVPLDNIDYFGFNRIVKDEEYVAMFGNFQPPPEVAAVPAPVAPVAPVMALAEPTDQDLLTPDPLPDQMLTPTSLKAATPMRSAILERFRARGPGSSNGTGS
jgi:hypothetical protein